jgi:hypothetical protein
MQNGVCIHKNTSQEVLFGQKTGDWICHDCGELFTSKKELMDSIDKSQAMQYTNHK